MTENFKVQEQGNQLAISPQPDPVLEQQSTFAETTLEALLASTQVQLNETRDAYMRARADGENTRRRAQEDMAKAHKFAVVSFAEAMIPVKDSLEMALMLDTPSLDLMKEGIELTLKQLTSAFERHGLKEIRPVRGDRIDPMKHQAVALVSAGDQDTNTVVTVLQKGYMIDDRLLRPAIVTAAQEKSSGM